MFITSAEYNRQLNKKPKAQFIHNQLIMPIVMGRSPGLCKLNCVA